MEPFEYAVRKDVRNNPIVREVDEARQRELWKSVGIAGLLVVVLLFSAWQHFELLRHGYQVEEIQRERAAEEEASRQLRLEIETLRSPQRIEALAIQKLHLVAPGRDDAIVIERVVPAEAPAKSVVARARAEASTETIEGAEITRFRAPGAPR
jgi:cell division protein FtsL